MLVLLVLGFAGGVPNVLVTTVAQAWTSSAGWSVTAIGALTFCTLPYALKFLWAPIVDGTSLPLFGRLGRRRGWLVVSQSLALLALVALSLWGPVPTDPAPGVEWTPGEFAAAALHNRIFFALLCAAAFFSATQDIVADAFRTESLEPTELGAGASTFVSGYRIAFVVLGAGVLLVAETITWRFATLGAALAMGLGVVATLSAREPELASGTRPTLTESLVQPVARFYSAWGGRVLFLAAFVLLFKLPDQLATNITTPLLMKGLAYSAESIGWVRQAFGFAMTIVGAAAGGWMVARLGIIRCLWIFGLAHSFSIAGFLALAIAYGATVHATPTVAPPVWALMPAIALENIVIGMVTSGFVAFLMSICDRRYTATQYALLTALMAAGNAVAGGMSGAVAEALDYPGFLVVAMLAGIPGLLLIPFVKPPVAAL
jgi:PAT family beta-lactamase induction signal transducer AmpG